MYADIFNTDINRKENSYLDNDVAVNTLFFSLLSGFSGKSINLYSYAANNPVMLEDPRGRCVPFFYVAGGPLGAVLGAGADVAAYIASRRITNQKISLGGM